MVRQILGAVSQFEKASLVAKLRHARERIRAEMGHCEGRKPGIDRLDEGETAPGRIWDPTVAMKREHTLAGDSLEPVRVAATDIPAVHSNKERAVRQRLVRPG
jgi:hypothetical protein